MMVCWFSDLCTDKYWDLQFLGWVLVLVIADTSIHVAVQLTKITHLHFTLDT